MADRLLPTQPGHWWVQIGSPVGGYTDRAVYVCRSEIHGLAFQLNGVYLVGEPLLTWLAPIRPHEEQARRDAELAELRELERLVRGWRRAEDRDDPTLGMAWLRAWVDGHEEGR